MQWLIGVISTLYFSFSFVGVVYAGSVDLFGGHNEAMKGETKAQGTAIYDAWGENMGRMIERGAAKGVVIRNGKSNNKDVVSDGAGNVTVKEGARITGPLIIKNEYKDTNIIVR
jgi:hypothetical protein